jgi:hypothetical protein
LNGSTRVVGLGGLLLLAAFPGRLGAQKVLDQFSSENLTPSAIGFDVGALAGTNILGTNMVAVRLDGGRIAPSVRVVLGVSYFSADLSSATVQHFEQRLRSFVIDPSGDDTIRLGSITWSDATGDLDFQYLMPQGRAVTAYLGFGFSVHVRHGSGAAIDGTFVQDALDAITAGLNGTLGAEFGSGRWRATIEGRGVLATGLATAGIAAGVRYRWAVAR